MVSVSGSFEQPVQPHLQTVQQLVLENWQVIVGIQKRGGGCTAFLLCGVAAGAPLNVPFHFRFAVLQLGIESHEGSGRRAVVGSVDFSSGTFWVFGVVHAKVSAVPVE